MPIALRREIAGMVQVLTIWPRQECCRTLDLNSPDTPEIVPCCDAPGKGGYLRTNGLTPLPVAMISP